MLSRLKVETFNQEFRSRVTKLNPSSMAAAMVVGHAKISSDTELIDMIEIITMTPAHS